MEETSNVPKLRFKEFTEPWEEILLKDNAYIKGRIGWKNLKQSEYTIKGPYLIASKHINNGKIYWEKCDHLSNKRYLESPEIALKLGDVIFSKDGSLGNPALIKYLPHESTINGTMMLVRVNSNISPNFFYQVLNSDYFFRLLHVLKSGSSIPHIFQRDMNNFKFKIPIKIKEQEMIADFLELIDNKINLLSSTIEYLKDFKNYCLQNLFSENKLRFIKRYNFDAKYVSDYLKESKIKASNDDINKHLTVKLNLKGVIPRESKTIEKEGATTQYIRKSGQFIYGKQNLYKGALGLIPKELDNFLSSSDIPSFDFINSVNHLWFYYYFSRKSFYECLEKYSTGTGSKRISPTDFLKIKLFIPPLEIQEKIASFLSLIDKKLDLTQNQIENMEKFKKGLLQQMFV
ncbi:restriction endonuclease subunit S [Methanobrevibacter sp. UBA412]|jgi:type I restriction enzyme S subunit|uniref:restriction endonuclease subunit S n=1 Tax=Methanobrevibacter sp. UBA412 TaxID=1915486 RepID=UPI0039B86183